MKTAVNTVAKTVVAPVVKTVMEAVMKNALNICEIVVVFFVGVVGRN